MPDLMASLQGQDLGHFRILAEQWGIELNAPDARHALQQIVPQILHAEIIQDVTATLPAEARQALSDLASSGGKLAWVRFTQRYGEIRQWGAGRRDRERPDQNPISAAERLWYLGVIGRANLDTPDGPVEFAYIPDDILAFLRRGIANSGQNFGRPASPQECVNEIPADDFILDDACTFLAALRCGLPIALLSVSIPFMSALMLEGHILDDEETLNSEETRRFLEMRRGDALRHLVQLWLQGTINDLRMLPSLKVEGELTNNPVRTRKIILDHLSALHEDRWWDLSDFILAMQRLDPDFQRPTGDYETWYLRDALSGDFRRGFEYWNDVEGALLRYLIKGPLHWLGILDLASAAPGQEVRAFRVSPWARALIQGEIPDGMNDEDQPFRLYTDGRITVPRLTRRAIRYQLARFSTWEEYKQDAYHYRLTPAALGRAEKQGLTVNHLLTLLNKHIPAIPPMLIRAIQRWEKLGTEVRMETVDIIRSKSPDILQTLRKSPAGRFLGDALGVNSIIVKPGFSRQVLTALTEMGILGEEENHSQTTGTETDGLSTGNKS